MNFFAVTSVILAVVSPFALLPLNWYAPLQSFRFIVLCVAVACAGIVGAWWFIQEKKAGELVAVMRHPAIIAVGCFIAWMIVRALISPDARMWFGSWTRFDGLWIFIILFFLLVVWAAYFQKNERTIALCAAVFFIVTVVTTLASRLLPQTPLWATFNEPRWSGFTGNSLYLAGTLLLLPWAAERARILYRRAYDSFEQNSFDIVFYLGVTAALLYFTLTRSALIAAAVGIVVLILHSSLHRIIRWGIVILFLATAVGALVGLPTRVTGVRTVLARAAVQDIAASPIVGYGWGNHINRIASHARETAAVVYGEQVQDTSHSSVLDIALGGGVIALIFLTVGFWYVWREANAVERGTLAALAVFATLSFLNPWSVAVHVFFVATIIARTISHRVFIKHIGMAAPIGAVVSIMVATASVFFAFLVARDAYSVTRGIVRFNWSPVRVDREVQTAFLMPPQESKLVSVLNAADAYGLSGRDLHTFSVVAASASTVFSAHRSMWLERSLAYNDRALALTPDRPDTVVQRADIYREQGNKTEALRAMREFALRNPQLPQAHFFYGVMLAIYEQNDTAIMEVKRAFELLTPDRWPVAQRQWGKEFIAGAPAASGTLR